MSPARPPEGARTGAREGGGFLTSPARPAGAARDACGPNWNGTLARSRFLDALSLLLPAGEGFVLAALDDARAARRSDPSAAPALQRFAREECAHQRAHERYNAQLVALRPGVAAQAERARRASEALAREALPTRLAFAAAFEQLTALLSHELLAHRHLLRHADPHGTHARLWRWHAREELAHCHVMDEVAREAGAGPLRRRFVLVVATVLLGADLLRGWRALCRLDVEAGVDARRLGREQASFALASGPMLARLAWRWAGLFVAGEARLPAVAGG